MAFLDNSGDIILDAVLTDTGRMRLAKGDGSFNIVKFALGDDEISYELYDKNHASGSAYYDIEILQTPVLEAFTNNTSTLKSKLLTVTRTNLLYLPQIKINTDGVDGTNDTTLNNITTVYADKATYDELLNGSNQLANTIRGDDLTLQGAGQYLIFDQGIESDAKGPSATTTLDSDLVETQYIIEMDNRFGFLADEKGNSAAPSFIDDDNIASYYLSVTTNPEYFGSGLEQSSPVFSGPLGYRLTFLVGPHFDLQGSTYLFTQLGGTSQIDPGSGNVDLYHIDTTIMITGATTGYRVDLPIRFVKKQ